MMEQCTYCGVEVEKPDREDVVPKCLYRESDLRNGPCLVKVPACRSCNASFSNDEAHFRNVLMLAGDPNDTVQRLWAGPVARSFQLCDGEKRKEDLRRLMRPQTPQGPHRVYPAEGPRVMRVVKKIVRGLSRHHGLQWPVSEEAVMADVLRWPVPPAFEPDVRKHDIVPEVFYYGYDDLAEPPNGSLCWVLTFFERTRFVAFVEPEAAVGTDDPTTDVAAP